MHPDDGGRGEEMSRGVCGPPQGAHSLQRAADLDELQVLRLDQRLPNDSWFCLF